MSVLTLKVDEVMRTLSAEGSNPFVVHDKEVDIVRFAINSGFADIVLDGQVALRVMYQRPRETEVRAQTLTYYDTDGLRNYYDWQLSQSDLAKNGSLMVALCILRTSGNTVEEWHTTPCAVKVLGSIHTDDSDEGDESITPTVAQRVAVLETMIQRVASGAPIVVASTSAMTDTNQIYVLSTDGEWYYHNGSAWVAGGEYGGVADGSVTTNKLADGAVTTAKIADGAVTAEKIANDLKSAINYNVIYAGNGNSYKESTFDVGLKAGNTYRVFVRKWDDTGMTVTTGYLFLLGYSSNGNITYVASVRGIDSSKIKEYYTLAIPDDAESPLLVVGGRTYGNAYLRVDNYYLLPADIETEEITPVEYPGYINVNGYYVSQSATNLEVFTGLFAYKSGDSFTLNVTGIEPAANKWSATVWLDRDYQFIKRDGSAPENAAYVFFCYRTYGVSAATVTCPSGSYMGINWRSVMRDIKGETVVPYFILGVNSYVDIDTTNKTIKIPSDTIVVYAAEYKILSAITIDYSSVNSSAIKVYMDLGTYEFTVAAYVKNDDFFKYDSDSHKVVVMAIRIPYIYPTYAVSAIFPWSINGKPYNLDVSEGIEYKIAEAVDSAVTSVNHRGYSSVAPENTLPAYKLSKKKGFLRVETDVSFTQDGVPVLLHDSTINRTARNSDGTELSETINVKDVTYNDLLQYDFGIWKSSNYAGTTIPTMTEFIVLCRNLGLHPYIELKSADTYSEAQIRSLVDIVKRNGMEGKVTWISFSLTYLTYVKNYDGNARLGYIVGTVNESSVTNALTLKTATNEVFLDSNDTSVNAATLCYNANLPLELWTINSVATILALDPYVSGVTSDSLIAAKVLYENNI